MEYNLFNQIIENDYIFLSFEEMKKVGLSFADSQGYGREDKGIFYYAFYLPIEKLKSIRALLSLRS